MSVIIFISYAADVSGKMETFFIVNVKMFNLFNNRLQAIDSGD